MDIADQQHLGVTETKTDVPKRFMYKWTFGNFDEPIHFSLCRTSSSNSQHYLTLHSCGSEKYLSISFSPSGNDEFSTESNVDFFILDNAKQLRNRTRAERTSEDSFECKYFIKQRDLFDPKQQLLNGNDFVIVCTSTKYAPVPQNIPDDSKIEFQKCKNEVNISNDFQKLLQNKLLADIILVASDGKLHAHKLILTARSPVFGRMIQSNVGEESKCEIVINDFGLDVLSEMLQFMYSDKVENLKDHIHNLVCLANKYEIEGLKLLCEEFLLEQLTVENVIEIFILVESQNCSMLRSKFLNFMISNASKIIESSKFQSLRKDLPSWLIDMLIAATSSFFG